MDISINLIRRCKNMERDAFDILLSSYEGQLYRLCFSYARNHESSMDIMQEVFIKVFRSINTFDESRSFWPWLKRIAINSCLNYERDQQKHVHAALDNLDLDKPDLINIIDSRTDIESDTAVKDMKRILEQVIAELPDSYRMVLTLRYVEDMTYKEMASNLEQPVGTVKSNLCRARNMLKRKLESSGLLEV